MFLKTIIFLKTNEELLLVFIDESNLQKGSNDKVHISDHSHSKREYICIDKTNGGEDDFESNSLKTCCGVDEKTVSKSSSSKKSKTFFA